MNERPSHETRPHNQRVRQLQEIAAVARRLPIPRQREYLDEVCRNSDERQRVLGSMRDGDVRALLDGVRPAPPTIAGLDLEAELGSGRRRRVFVAFDRSERRWVVVQLVAVPRLDHALRRLRREIEYQHRFHVPGIGRIHRVDGCGTGRGGGGELTLVTELVEGLRWDDYCKGLELRDRLRCLLRTCRAVQRAHDHLLFHGDLRPRNLRIESNGVPRVLDFAVARTLDESGREVGDGPRHQLRYVCPEWREYRRDSGPLADVYSLGVLGAELLGLLAPTEGAGPSAAELRERLQDLQPCDHDLRCILLNAVDPSPTLRTATVRELAEDLESYLEDRPVLAASPSWLRRLTLYCRRQRRAVSIKGRRG